jgi:sortase B
MILLAVLLLLAVLAAGTGVFLVWQERTEREAQEAKWQTYAQLRQEASFETLSEAQDGQTVIPVDFEAWQEVNPDVYAWITIPGTVIDYPIVQNAEDNSYYITRNAELEESASGAIYSENLNHTDFSDIHTVLYGQNMEDGSMFGSLSNYENESFFDAHREIMIYTPDEVLCYRIFAAYVYDNRHLLKSFDLEDSKTYTSYLKNIMAQRNIQTHLDRSMDIEAGDQLLTLSTHCSEGEEYRYLVQAVLEKPSS